MNIIAEWIKINFFIDSNKLKCSSAQGFNKCYSNVKILCIPETFKFRIKFKVFIKILANGTIKI
jgi:hypothetical protein